MRSPVDCGLNSLLPSQRAVLAAGLLWGALANAAPPLPPTQSQVEAALTELQADPNLNAKEVRRELEFKPWGQDDKPEKAKPEPKSSRSRDSGAFVSGLEEAGRWLMWLLAGVAIVFVALGFRHWIRAGALVREQDLADLPSHVRNLDIRPDSLPPSVGRTAWDLWQRGEKRAALSLLYRATLSRLVHVHAVPILSASTEGECVQLARPRLEAGAFGLVEHIVRAWQMTVYGARSPDDAVIQSLCQRFDLEMPDPSLQGSDLR